MIVLGGHLSTAEITGQDGVQSSRHCRCRLAAANDPHVVHCSQIVAAAGHDQLLTPALDLAAHSRAWFHSFQRRPLYGLDRGPMARVLD
jgi:hypothetical protein